MRKKLQLEILDPVGNTAVTHHFFYVAGEGNRLRLTITDNVYLMDKDGKLVILTQEEMDREESHNPKVVLDNGGSQPEPKYLNKETGKVQRLFCEETLIPSWSVQYSDPNVGNKGESVTMNVSANSEDDAKVQALGCRDFTQHILPEHYDSRYLTAFKAVGNFKIGEIRYFEGDPRL